MSGKHSSILRGLTSASRSPSFQGRFGRIFGGLPPAVFGRNESENEAALVKLAAALSAEPDGAKDGFDEEESGIPALYTYFGQFIDHDLTFDPASSLQKQNDPDSLSDFRTPAFDLDSVYGRGPDDQPYLYNAGELLLGDPLNGGDANATDLQRNPRNRRALIGDPRNDENTIVAQLHTLFIRFHNRVLSESGRPFEEVQQIVRFHYQYVVLNDFLPRLVSHDVLHQLKTNGHYDRRKLEIFHWRNDPFIPVEFSGAAYRFGHSQVRTGYRLNDDDDTLVNIFPGLTGFRPINAGNGIDWGRFIDVDTRSYGGDTATDKKRLQFAYRIDTSLVDPLANLPPSVASGGPISLPERNLKRGWRLGLPSGQAVARAIGVKPLRDDEIVIGKATDTPDSNRISIVDVDPIFADNAPLWVYILAEAAHHKTPVKIPVVGDKSIQTPQLGPVGGRIVAEVFLGLLYGDPSSLLSLDRNWHPHAGPHYTLKDFVNYALGR